MNVAEITDDVDGVVCETVCVVDGIVDEVTGVADGAVNEISDVVDSVVGKLSGVFDGVVGNLLQDVLHELSCLHLDGFGWEFGAFRSSWAVFWHRSTRNLRRGFSTKGD